MTTLTSLDKTLVLVGLMGAGKSTIGRMLAGLLGLPFADSDQAIMERAGCSIDEIFATRGEEGFRALQKEVIAGMLDGAPRVLATGGSAYLDPDTRALIDREGIAIWLKADLDTLMERTRNLENRPLLKGGDRREILGKLIEARYPIYGLAAIAVDTDGKRHNDTVETVIDRLKAHLRAL
ncbi:MAG: shikimate kinase [Alphaproteobacteria bacterium]|nr:shikimate kinase [Alphaproteobacteria bacterium]